MYACTYVCMYLHSYVYMCVQICVYASTGIKTDVFPHQKGTLTIPYVTLNVITAKLCAHIAMHV